jgi:hypothetical protein
LEGVEHVGVDEPLGLPADGASDRLSEVTKEAIEDVLDDWFDRAARDTINHLFVPVHDL